MSNPPETFSVPVSSIWQQITRIPRPSRIVDFPRIDPGTGEPACKVLMRVLTEEELENANVEAEKYARQKLKEFMPHKDESSYGYDSLFNNELSVQLLARAMYQVDEPSKLFCPSPKALRSELTQDEVGMLMRVLLITQAELGPIVSRLTEEEMEGWIKRLVEGASGHPLAQLSSEALTELIMHMAHRLSRSSTDTSLPGSQPEDSSPPNVDPLSLEATEPSP